MNDGVYMYVFGNWTWNVWNCEAAFLEIKVKESGNISVHLSENKLLMVTYHKKMA